jgi:hypothetical protein
MQNTAPSLTKKMKKRTTKLEAIVFLILFSIHSIVFAEDINTTTSAAASKKEKKKTLNFEDELVEGSTQKPELFYLFQKKNFNYKRLIKLRENFLPEMKQTSEDLQRARSSN